MRMEAVMSEMADNTENVQVRMKTITFRTDGGDLSCCVGGFEDVGVSDPELPVGSVQFDGHIPASQAIRALRRITAHIEVDGLPSPVCLLPRQTAQMLCEAQDISLNDYLLTLTPVLRDRFTAYWFADSQASDD